MGLSRCMECAEYQRLDEDFGFCEVTHMPTLAECESCERFCRMKTCLKCRHFEPLDNSMGQCRFRDLVYPNVPARDCAHFAWR